MISANGHYVAFEGKLWKTLALLMTRPGRLTSEYLAGRRQRYVAMRRVYGGPWVRRCCAPSSSA